MPDAEDAPAPPPVTSKPAPAPVPGKVTLIGTGHVFDIQATIMSAIEAIRPDIVFVELDRGRLQALLYRRQHGRDPPQPARSGFIHKKLHGFQKGIAGMYGAEVGGEMIAAVEAASRVGARVMLVDAPVEQTLKRALSQLTLREKLRAVGMLIKGGFQSLLPKRDAKEDVEAEIKRYQQDPGAALDELGRTFPTVRRVLIDERDTLMATRIRAGVQGARHGVAVLGDGHLPGILAQLEDLAPNSYRLEAVRAGALPKPEALDASVATGDSVNVGFGFDVQSGPPQGL